jgi:hypothetical protein
MTDEKQDRRQFRTGRVKENRAPRLTRIVWDFLDVILSPILPSLIGHNMLRDVSEHDEPSKHRGVAILSLENNENLRVSVWCAGSKRGELIRDLHLEWVHRVHRCASRAR